jgi:thiol-disulfide isomerase/thioredoxin
MQARLRAITFLLAIALFCPSLLCPLMSCPSLTASAQEVEKKPLVLVVYADWCPMCQSLKPVLVLMNDRYRGQIHYVLLDVTTEATTAKSRAQAQSLGLEKFFDRNFATTSLVVIKDPAGHELFRAVHDYDFHHYEAVLNQQLHLKPSQ